MKKTLLSATIMAFVLVSCNQKNKEETTNDDSHMMANDSTMMNNDSTMMNHSKMDHSKIYACPMHPEVQGKMHDKCSQCGMELTVPVPEKTNESK